MQQPSEIFRALPAVDTVLDALALEKGLADIPRALLRDLINEFLDSCRKDVRAEKIQSAAELSLGSLLPRLITYVRAGSRPSLCRVLNATGVVVHTNLGRSTLCPEAAAAVQEACAHYSNLEMDLTTGRRGSRHHHVEGLLCRLTGAEAAVAVNNNAGAVLLVLNTLAQGREVVVSRGQLVEIGGSFRIPDVMSASGAIMREVGTTNRTHPRDYESAIGSDTAALLRVHPSNYHISGFTKEVSLRELAKIGSRHGLPVIDDLGSGSLMEFSCPALAGEPTAAHVVAEGADVATFSGDKILGGPQAGIIVGKKEYIERIKNNPLHRALRLDKLTLAALEATLRLYLDPARAVEQIPTLRMITADPASLKRRAQKLARLIRKKLGGELEEKLTVATVPGASRTGGGAFPEATLPTTLVRLDPAPCGLSVDDLRDALGRTDPPLLGRIEEDGFHLDVRTLEDSEFPLVVSALRQATTT